MSTREQFVTGPLGKTPTTIVGYDTSLSTVTAWASQFQNPAGNCKKTLSGALTADTYKTLLSITGGGVISFLGAAALDTTIRTITVKLTLDGVVVKTTSATANATNHSGPILIGSSGEASSITFQDIPFSSSMLIEVKSSLTETDLVALYTNYRTI